MHPALLLLLRLRFVARLRRIRRGLSTRRGLLIALALAVVFLPGLLGVIVLAFVREPPRDFGLVREIVPLLLLAVTVLMSLTTGTGVLTFRPDEVDLLFAGPFTRRHLLLYKILETTLGSVFVAVFLGLWQGHHFPRRGAAMVGIWIGFLFVQLLSLAVVLMRKAVGDPATAPPVRRTALGLLVILLLALVAGGAQIAATLLGTGELSARALIEAARASTLVSAVLVPFDALTAMMTAHTLSGMAGWGAVSLVMCGLLLVLIVRLDAYFVESSLAASHRLRRRLARLRGSGGLAFSASSRRVRVPMWWLGGAGPIAWRQMTNALRNGRSLLFMLVMIGIAVAPVIFLAMRQRGEVPEAAERMLPVVAGGMVGMMLMLVAPSFVRFDFRSDIDLIDALKALPLPSRAVVLGQIATPAMIIFLTGCGLLVPLLVLSGAGAGVVMGVLLLLAPLSLLLSALENLVFLLYPVRPPAGNPADAAMIARNMIAMLIKSLVLLAALGPAAALGGLLWWLGGHWLFGAAAGAAALVAAVAGLVPVMAGLYDRFDVSLDTPG